MRLFHASETPVGTYEIAETLGQSLARILHHLQILRRRGLIALVEADEDEETFYVSRVRDQAAITVFLAEQDNA